MDNINVLYEIVEGSDEEVSLIINAIIIIIRVAVSPSHTCIVWFPRATLDQSSPFNNMHLEKKTVIA